MGAKDDGGPAFPHFIGPESVMPGMTLRDYFAAQAVTSILNRWGIHHKVAHASMAERAYQVADAMLSERAKGGWQPINTAPKDGRRVIIARDMGEPWGWVIGLAYYASIKGIEGWIATAGASEIPGVLGLAEPTHWQPFPAPPARASKPSGGAA